MNNELLHLLSVRRLPGRVNAEQAAHLLGFAVHDVPVLVKAKLLKSIGSPTQQSIKYFAAVTIESLAKDETWLHRATRAIYNHWRDQNLKRKGGPNTAPSTITLQQTPPE